MSYNPFKGDFDEEIYSDPDYIVSQIANVEHLTLDEKLRHADEIYVSLFPDSYPWGDSKWNSYAESMACAFFEYYIAEMDDDSAPRSIGRLYEENSPILQDALDAIRMTEIVDFMEFVSSEDGDSISSETYAEAMKLAMKIAFCNETTAFTYFSETSDVMTYYFPKFSQQNYKQVARSMGSENTMTAFNDPMSQFVFEMNDSVAVWQSHVLVPYFDDDLYINPIDKSLDYYETFRAVLECLLSPVAGMVVFHKPSYSEALVGKVIMFQNGQYCYVGESIIVAMGEYLRSHLQDKPVCVETLKNETQDDYEIINSIAAYCNMLLTIMSFNEREIMPISDKKVFLYEQSSFLKTSVEDFFDDDSFSIEYDADKLFINNTIDYVFDHVYNQIDLMPTSTAISIANLAVLYNSVLNTFLGKPIEPIIEAVIKFGEAFEKKNKEPIQQTSVNFDIPAGIIEKICASHDVNDKINLLDDIYNSMDSNSKDAVDSVVNKIEKNLDRTVTVTVAYDSSEQKIKDLLHGKNDNEGRRLEVITVEFCSPDMKFNIKDKKRIRSIITKSLIEKDSYVVVTYSPEKKSSIVFLSCVQWDGTNCNDQGLDASLELLSSLRVQIPLNSECDGNLSFDYIELGDYPEE